MEKVKSCSIISLALLENSENEVIKEKILANFEKLKSEMVRLAEKEGVCDFYFGMEKGAELMAAKYAVENKENLSIKVTCVMPFEEQAAEYEEEERNNYYSVFEKADREIIYKKHRDFSCKKDRDIFLINNSDYIIILNGEKEDFSKICFSPICEKKELIFIN